MLSVSPVEIRPADATQVDDLVRAAPLEEFAPGAPAYLATPCEVLVFQRSIG